MSTTKKSLATKLKKNLATASKKKMMAFATLGESSATTADIHRSLIDRILNTGDNDESYQTVIQEHVNFYPNDRVLLRVSMFNVEKRLRLFTTLKTRAEQEESFDLIEYIIDQIPVESTTTVVDVEKNTTILILEGLLSSSDYITVQRLVAIDDVVFEPLVTMEFLSDESEDKYCRLLITEIIKTESHDVRKVVEMFIYNNRYYEILRILEDPSINDKDKQNFSEEYLRNQYESIRSKQFFILVWNLVDRNTYPFKKQLESLLFRFVADKKFVPQIRKNLTLALDVIIHKNKTDKYLSKFFLTKQGLVKFKTQILPLLENQRTQARYIKSVIRNEFEHPYLYRQAHRIEWKTLLRVIQNLNTSAILNMETQLIMSLQQNRASYVNTILKLLVKDTPDLKFIRSVIQQFISTYKPNEQKVLGKLLTLPVPALVKFFEDTAMDQYMTVLGEIPKPTKSAVTKKSSPKNNIMSWASIEKDNRIFLEKYRIEILDFKCLLIEAISEATTVIEKYSNGFFEGSDLFLIPNDDFYVDCAIGQCVQNKNIFTINGTSVKVYYYTQAREMIIQDESLYAQHLRFVERQMTLYDASEPIEYLNVFSKMPLMNHTSNVMKKLRHSIAQRLENVGIASSVEIEQSIFSASSSIQQYLETWSRLLMVTDASASTIFAKSLYFRELWNSGILRGDTLPEILQGTWEFSFHFLYPEYFQQTDSSRQMLIQKAEVVTRRIYKTLVLRAFVIEHPMSRLPILPTDNEMTMPVLNKIEPITKLDVLYGFSDEPWHDQPIANAKLYSDIQKYFSVSPVSRVVVSDTTTTTEVAPVATITTNPDPLRSFYDTAMMFLEEL